MAQHYTRPEHWQTGALAAWGNDLCDVIGALNERGRYATPRHLRRMSDEDLFREMLALRRLRVSGVELAATMQEAYGLRDGLIRLIIVLEGIDVALDLLRAEERRRERARALGVPRDGAHGWAGEAFVRAVKRRVDLVDLILRWGLTELRATGAPGGGQYRGGCPFHAEETPSFYVYAGDPDDQHYHCFGCQAHGDVFDLARSRAHWLTFREAVEGLAGIAGLPLPARMRPPDPPRRLLDLARGAGADA